MGTEINIMVAARMAMRALVLECARRQQQSLSIISDST